ncbi:hypothetical protein BJ878DRAFT_484602 [Calycina marina]|uniref:Rhodopsin domain-containing protein n=1 Tax=Calycina marina TaxID=1763456 RepID=A0A9P7ZCZ8_9HELO|nr:hypothetical protein BJ878DRAFT_484602 [Calycina marina]
MNIGYQLALAMWVLTLFSLTLVVLRLYTRVRIVKFVGAEDYMYVCTGIFLLGFTIFIQVAVQHGLGQNFWELSIPDSSDAIFWTYVANTFAVIGNAMAKLSMGLFLLRVVQVTWHKIALWFLVFVTVTSSSALAIMLWLQTTPIKASWDPLRTPGHWKYKIQSLSIGLGAWSSACDFFFAIFPWLFIWALRMPKRDKILLASGMSLGVIAGACGITRTIVLSRIDVLNYTLNFVPYFAWAGAEIAVAMICVGIPTLRPLYLKSRGITPTIPSTSRSRNNELPQFIMVKEKPVVSDPIPLSPNTQPTPSALEAGLSRQNQIELKKPERMFSKSSSMGSWTTNGSRDENVGKEEGVRIWVQNEVKILEDDAQWPLAMGSR